MIPMVHLADERESSNIRKNGIKIGKFRRGVYCLPVTSNFFVSHQWLRELKRRGVKTYVGIYFKADPKQLVYAGKYNEEHKHITLGDAIKELNSLKEPLGYEIIMTHKILPKDISKIKHLPQTIGWRYMPGSNGKWPCPCDYCTRGDIKGSRLRKKLDPQEKAEPIPNLMAKLLRETDTNTIENVLSEMSYRRTRVSPKALGQLLEKNKTEIDSMLALALKAFRHKDSKALLLKLIEEKIEDTTLENAAFSLLSLYGHNAVVLLSDCKKTPVQAELQNWLAEQNKKNNV